MKIVRLVLVLFAVGLPVLAQSSKSNEASRLNNEAVSLAEQSKFDEALKVINEAILLAPDDVIIIENKSSFLRSLGRDEEALALLNDGLKKFPMAPELRFEQVMVLSDLNLTAESHREQLKMYSDGLSEPDARDVAMLPPLFEIPDAAVAPQKNEIELQGFFLGSDKNALQVEAYLFVSPNGRAKIIPPKVKSVSLNGIEPEYAGVGPVPVTELKSGDFVVLVGQEGKDGFKARRIMVGARSSAEEKKRGSLFNAGALKWIENQDYPKDDSNSDETTFVLKGGEKMVSGVSNLIHDGDKTAVVTSLTSFREDDDSEKHPWLSVNERAKMVADQVVKTREIHGVQKPADEGPLPAPVQVTLGQPFPGGEILAVPVKNDPTSLTLAAVNPVRGEIVYVEGWYDRSIWWREAVVVHADAIRLFLLVGPEGEEERLLGSAILNRKGEVVGIHIGGDARYNSGVSADALRRAIQKSAGVQ